MPIETTLLVVGSALIWLMDKATGGVLGEYVKRA
jgi:hypothetical protein